MKSLISFITLVLFTATVFSQAPQKISYQAVIRNSSNALGTSSAIGMQVSILQGSIFGTEVYKEIYSPNPQTNTNGLVTLEIGSGTPVTGSFATIDWSAGPYFLKTEIDPLAGTNYIITGITQLLSVPYSLYSETAGSIKGGITEADPIFTNHVASGITSTNITDWSRANVWGDHRGLYSLIDHAHPYLSLSGGEMGNSNLVSNLNSDLLDGQHGSFYAPSTGSGSYIQNQNSSAQSGNIWISGDSKIDGKVYVNGIQSIYVPNQTNFEGSLVIGTGGLKLSTLPPISPSGYDGNLGKQNTFIGIEAGRDNASGNQNTFVGTWAGINNTVGDQNTFVGMNAGASNTSGWHSTYVGAWAGYQNTTGSRNAFFGTDAGNYNTTGSENSFFGDATGVFNSTGSANSFFGLFAGSFNNGDGNSFFGRFSGYKNISGSFNTFIGTNAGNNTLQKIDAFNSVALGNEAYTTKDNQIVIGNSKITETVLNGKVNIGDQIKNVSTTGISLGSGSSSIEFNGSNFGTGYGHIIRSVDDVDIPGVDLRIAGRMNATTWTDLISIRNNGNVGIGYISGTVLDNNKLAVNGTAFISNNLTVPSITITTGKTSNSVLIGDANGLGTWRSITDSGIAPSSGSSNYIQNQNLSAQTANLWISGIGKFGGSLKIGDQSKTVLNYGISLGTDNSAIEFVGSNWGSGYGHIIRSVDSGDGTGVDLRFAGRKNSLNWTDLLAIKNNGNIGIGYSTGSEIKNNKLAVDGNIYANGTITVSGGKSTDWNAAYSWGNHSGLYKPISYAPDWGEITSNPFSFSLVTDGQLLKYNAATQKWENWTPNSLTTYTENDPIFAAWNKTSGITITTSQVSDFQSGVTNAPAVLANSAKNSYPTADAIKLANIAAGAEVNVNADWNATSGDAQILNKPSLPVGNNPGDMQYWDGTAWVMIPAGQPGQFLQFTTGNKPAWTTVLPILITTAVSSITNNSATSGGNILTSGGDEITARGVCWSTSPNPTVFDNKTTDGTGTGMFTSLLTGLTTGTTYYIRAYATNSSFTAYGNVVLFSTLLNN